MKIIVTIIFAIIFYALGSYALNGVTKETFMTDGEIRASKARKYREYKETKVRIVHACPTGKLPDYDRLYSRGCVTTVHGGAYGLGRVKKQIKIGFPR